MSSDNGPLSTATKEVIWDEASVRSFYLEQFKAVRALEDKLSDETRVTERYILGACGAIYTFILSRDNQLQASSSVKYIYWIPVVLALWGAVRSFALYDRMKQCGYFTKEAECKLRLPQWQGWEHWLTDPTREKHLQGITAETIWALIVAGTVAIACIALLR